MKIGSQSLRDSDGTIGILIVLADRNQNPWACADCVVQCVTEADLIDRALVAKIEPSGLEFIETGSRMGLAVAALGVAALLTAGHPRFDVHLAGILNPNITRAALDHAIWQLELLH